MDIHHKRRVRVFVFLMMYFFGVKHLLREEIGSLKMVVCRRGLGVGGHD